MVHPADVEFRALQAAISGGGFQPGAPEPVLTPTDGAAYGS